MGNIATKRRNCLSTKKADGLAFLATNMHLTELSSVFDDATEFYLLTQGRKYSTYTVDKL